MIQRRKVNEPHAVTDGEIILAVADIDLSPERVYAALITQETEKWWGSDDIYHITDWKSDVKVGGSWSLSVIRHDGMSFPASGQFLELDHPHKIVLTRKYDWDYPGLGRNVTKVTYLLTPIESGTNLVVRHEDFHGYDTTAFEHEPGWEQYLLWLQNYGKSQKVK